MYRAFGKRLYDLIIALSVLACIWPVLIVISLWIRLDSPGPALFMQPRVGRGQRIFKIFKFRTMHIDEARIINQRSQAIVAADDDPRITHLGQFLRRTSIDELPQLLNVITGAMSIVGPRPVLVDQLEAMRASDLARFNVPPGVTGLSQIKGRRWLAWPRQMRFDTIYSRRMSFRLDIAILWKTLSLVFGASGIYGGEAQNWRSHLSRGQSGQDTQRRAV